MTEYKSIDRSKGLAPAYSLETRDLQRLFDDAIVTNAVALEIPNNQGFVQVEGPWQSITLDCRTGQAVVTINGVDTLRAKLFAPVELYVALTHEVAQGITGELLLGEVSSGQAAQSLASQAGVALQWDTRLNYPLVNALEPLWHYSGILLEGLRKIIEPFNQGGEELAAIFPDVDAVRVVAVVEKNPITLDVGAADVGHFIESLTIQRAKRARPLRRVIYNIDTPRVLATKTEQSTHTYTDQTGQQQFRVDYTKTHVGPIILAKETTKYVWWPGGGIVSGRWVLMKRETITNTYDPTPTPQNVLWRRDFRLARRVEEIIHYRNDGQPGWGETNDIAYTYDANGYIRQEIQNQCKTQYYGPDTGKDEGQEVIQEYERITDELYVVSRQTRSYTEWVSGDNEVIWEENITYDTQLCTGQPPRVSPIAPVRDDSRVDHQEETLDLGAVGESLEVNWFGHDEYWSWFQARVQAERFTVRFEAPSMYDLRPGLWIDLTTSADTVIKAIQGNIVVEVALRDILDYLPPLFVRSVVVERQGSRQITRVEAVGWK